LWACFVVSLAGCGGILGIEDFDPPTIRGQLRDITSDFVPSAAVALRHDNGAPLTQVTTDAEGRFEIPITEQLPLDGYFEVLSPGFVPTINRLLTPVIDHVDTSQDVFTTTPAGLALLEDDADTTLSATQWLVLAVVVDAGGGTIAKATVTAMDSDGQPVDKVCYTRQDITRPCALVSTGSDGLAWLFGAKQNDTIVVSATDADGVTYQSTVRTFAGSGIVFAPIRPTP
jgi:hypothetical protein